MVITFAMGEEDTTTTVLNGTTTCTPVGDTLIPSCFVKGARATCAVEGEKTPLAGSVEYNEVEANDKFEEVDVDVGIADVVVTEVENKVVDEEAAENEENQIVVNPQKTATPFHE